MNQNTRDNYKNAILETYFSKENTDLSVDSEKPSPANIKRRLLTIISNDSFSSTDENALRIYLDLDKTESLINGIKKDTEVYKSLQNFFLKKTNSVTKPGLLEVAAILVNYKHRPISNFEQNKKEGEEKKEGEGKEIEIEKKIEKEVEKENTASIKTEKIHEIPKTVKLNPQATHKNDQEKNKKSNKKRAFLFFLLCIVIGFFLLFYSQHSKPLVVGQLSEEKVSVIEPIKDTNSSEELTTILNELEQMKKLLIKDSIKKVVESKKKNEKLNEEKERNTSETVIEKEQTEIKENKKEKKSQNNSGTPLNFNTKPINVAQGIVNSNGPIGSPQESENLSETKTKKIITKNSVELCFNNPNFYPRRVKLIHKYSDFETLILISGENPNQCLYSIPLGIYKCEVYTTFTKKLISQYDLKITNGQKKIRLSKDQFN